MIRAALAGIALALVATSAADGAESDPAGAPIRAVEIVSPHRLPPGLAELAIGDPSGRPLSRDRIRESLDRLWALGLFSSVEVEAEEEPGGIRLRYRLARRPHVERLEWTGETGLDTVDLAGAAALAIGGSAEPDRLERARRDVLALYAAEGYLGASVAVRTQTDPASNGRAVTFTLAPGKRVRVGGVEIAEVPGVDAQALHRAFALTEGKPYRERTVRDGTRGVEKALRDLGFFEARVTLLEPSWDRSTDRVHLAIAIDPGRKTLVEFEGLSALKETILRERLTFAEAGVVDEVEVRASARQIEALFREHGHHFVEVGGALGEQDEAPTVRFHILEGPQVIVESVDFVGAVSVPADALRSQMQTRPPGLFQRGLFVQEVLDRDLRVLLRHLRSLGYDEAAVGPARVDFSEDRMHARISITLLEGPRTRVGGVAVRGNQRLATGAILAVIPMKVGDPWDGARAEEASRLIERLYARHGHHAARVALATTPRGDWVDLAFEITEGEPTRIGRVLISGLTLTKEHVVRRELPFKTGAPLSPDDMAEARRRLAATRLFERVDVEPVRPPATPFADVELFLRDAKPWRLDLGAGYASEEGLRGFIEVGHDNLFGTGRSVSLRERVSQRGDRTEVAYREPWVLDTPWQGELKLFREQRDEIGYDTDRRGATATVARDILTDRVTGLRAALRYRFETFRRSNIEEELLEEDVTERDDQVGSISPILTWDLRQQPVDPRRGSFHLASIELGSEALGGRVNFVKSRLETSWFFDWLPPTVLAVSARLGLAWPFAGTDQLVIEDRFFAGGSNTVRGYRENRIGPLDSDDDPEGGNAQIILNLEWRFPIWGWIGGVVFADAGAIASTVAELSPGDLHPGVGAGLRIATPIGPIRFDVGYGLKHIEDEKRLQFYLTIGHAF